MRLGHAAALFPKTEEAREEQREAAVARLHHGGGAERDGDAHEVGQVECEDRERRRDERDGEVAAGVTELGGDGGRRRPAVEGEGDRRRGGEPGKAARASASASTCDARRASTNLRPPAENRTQANGSNGDERRHLDHGKGVLRPAGEAWRERVCHRAGEHERKPDPHLVCQRARQAKHHARVDARHPEDHRGYGRQVDEGVVQADEPGKAGRDKAGRVVHQTAGTVGACGKEREAETAKDDVGGGEAEHDHAQPDAASRGYEHVVGLEEDARADADAHDEADRREQRVAATRVLLGHGWSLLSLAGRTIVSRGERPRWAQPRRTAERQRFSIPGGHACAAAEPRLPPHPIDHSTAGVVTSLRSGYP